MARHVAGTFRAILLAVRTELASFLTWDTSRIAIVAGDADVPHRVGDHDMVLRARAESPDRSAIDGGGRRNNKRTRTFDVEVRSRRVSDRAGEDLQALTTVDTGHLDLEDRVVDCLEDYFPLDNDGNSLVSQGLVCQGLSKAEREREDPQWLSSSWTIEVLYRRDLDETRGAV